MTSEAKKSDLSAAWRHHLSRDNWLTTPDGNARGYIQPHALKELWFHTGSRCNLGCWFCLEGSGPDADHIEAITFADTRTVMDQALNLGVEQFSFTGGEPFVNPDMLRILDYALDHKPCLVLTNGSQPLRKQLVAVSRLSTKSNPLKFRISIDFPDSERHDQARGKGSFQMALRTLKDLHESGFQVSVARHKQLDEDEANVRARYGNLLVEAGLPVGTPIIGFTELHRPGSDVEAPHITENCMTTYKDEKARAEFMCAYSKMVVKIDGRVKVYACTLVDDDPDYALSEALTDSMDVRVMLKHHRCYACFSSGTSCSER